MSFEEDISNPAYKSLPGRLFPQRFKTDSFHHSDPPSIYKATLSDSFLCVSWLVFCLLALKHKSHEGKDCLLWPQMLMPTLGGLLTKQFIVRLGGRQKGGKEHLLYILLTSAIYNFYKCALLILKYFYSAEINSFWPPPYSSHVSSLATSISNTPASILAAQPLACIFRSG